MSYKISVVIPAYNEQRSIAKCLDSLLNQTYKDFEIVVVDNSSRDRTVQVVKKYQKRNRVIRLLRCKKRGVSAARNIGWRSSRAEYIFFLDADEILPPDFMKELSTSLGDPKEIISPKRLPKATNLVSKIRVVQNSPLDARVTAGLPRIFSKKLLEELGGYDEFLEVNEDLDLRRRALGKAFKIVDLNLVWYHLEPDTFYEYLSQASWMGKNYIKNIRRFLFRTLVFYGVHLANLLILFSLVAHLVAVKFGVRGYDQVAMLMIVLWCLHQIVNMSRLYHFSRTSLVLLVPVFDFVKSIAVFIGLILRYRI